ncbi:MAG: DUF1566 domain-containing protein [Chloroflexota bacterium]|nr:DUF1566 domain-containing protein [Chloroflexota bacterium]
MFKKISLLLMISLLILTLAACAASESQVTESPSTVEVSTASSPTVASPTETPATETPTATDQVVSTGSYPIVDTGQTTCYDDSGEQISCPAEGEAFYGQDAQYTGNAFSFTDNGDGTVTDNVTGLTWEQSPNSGPSTWPDAQEYCEALTLGGLEDWRMPNLKELFSISDFSAGWPYLDTTYFDLTDTDAISKDEQYWADNYYVGKTVQGQYDAAFGVNHVTGHIKAYPALKTGPMGKYVRCVSGDEYGINDFVDNGDGTITDNATALMWMQTDSGEGMDWETALDYAQEMNEANYLGYSDWRLPNVKELQSIVDYNYAPDAQDEAYDGPALDPMFSVSEITNEAGELDYPYYLSSTSARFKSGGDYYYAWYVAAGRAVDPEGNDSHGAGAVRFDVKVEGGPAGEGGERVYDYVRLVRGGDVTETPEGDPTASSTVITGDLADGSSPDQPAGPAGPGGQPTGSGGRQMPDMAAAAAQLGVTEEALQAALGDPSQGPPDFAAAAEALGVAEADLLTALGVPANGQPPTGGQPPAGQGPGGGQPPANRP